MAVNHVNGQYYWSKDQPFQEVEPPGQTSTERELASISAAEEYDRQREQMDALGNIADAVTQKLKNRKPTD